MEISVGVLIVGSLRWDNDLREAWRSERLELNREELVRAPIRYGRKSETRGDSYTMVFSDELVQKKEMMGQAIAVPCASKVHDITGLVEEAERLWTVERNKSDKNGKISAPWGSVALIDNPKNPMPEKIRKEWASRVAREEHYGNLDRTNEEQDIVDQNGILRIPWPQCIDGSSLNLNGLLATATRPSLTPKGTYPCAQRVAAAWCTPAGKKKVDYYLNNIKHGILTFEDNEIRACLPPELSKGG